MKTCAFYFSPRCRFAFIVASVFQTALSFAQVESAGGKERTIGSGIVYPAAVESLSINPATSYEGKPWSAEAMWRFNAGGPFVGIRHGQKKAGLAADYRSESLQNSAGQDGESQSTIQAGGSLMLEKLALGATLRKRTSVDPEADLGLIFDFLGLRWAAVLRGIGNDLSRFDLGIGWGSKTLYASINYKQPLPYENANGNALLDFSAAANVNMLSFGIGIYASKDSSGVNDSQLHGDAAILVNEDATIKLSYLPNAQEWYSTDNTWAAALHYTF